MLPDTMKTKPDKAHTISGSNKRSEISYRRYYREQNRINRRGSVISTEFLIATSISDASCLVLQLLRMCTVQREVKN
jgi:hypothetical protein